MRLSKAIRATAWGMVVAGVAAPLMRKRLSASPLLLQAIAFGAPVGLCVAVPRSRGRDIATCSLQMWAYLAAYKTPHDDAETQASRVHIDYPIAVDRVLGLGKLPTVRLQQALARTPRGGGRALNRASARGHAGRGEWRTLDRVLVWVYWSWFIVPHGTLVYILMRHRARFARAAVLTYAVFDLGASVYWFLPTAPPWYAAQTARERGKPTLAVRRMMVEYGEQFWKDGWGSLYSVFGGNPLAAMPSLHFATSVMAAFLLAEVGPLAGALGFGYTATLGFALVYLGEHYAVDLLGGAMLTAAVRWLAPCMGSTVARFGRAVVALEEMAHEVG